MELYKEPKSPSEVKDYSWDWDDQLSVGETITGQTVTMIDAAGASVVTDSYSGTVSKVWFSGGTVGSRIVYVILATTSGGRQIDEGFGVDVVDKSAAATVSATRTAAEVAAELAEYRTARTTLVKGERVKDVYRDGRRMAFSEMTLESIEKAIASLTQEYSQAASAEAGRPRRRAIGLAYRN